MPFPINPSQAVYGSIGWFFYNNVAILITSIHSYFKEAIYNGPDYLYTRHTVHIRGYINPAATSYTLRNGFIPGTSRPLPPIYTGGAHPANTVQAIESALMEPRRFLTWIIGPSKYDRINWVILASPDPTLPWGSTVTTGVDQPVDANNGPVPVYANVVKMVGTETFVVDYIIRTDLNPINSPSSVGTQSPLLSNRWTMTQALDDQYFTTRSIHGTAIFRTDTMALLNTRADDFRDWFFFPVPLGFKRLQPVVTLNEAGNAVTYNITDREEQVSILNTLQPLFGVVNIECSHDLFQQREAATGALGNALKTAGRSVMKRVVK